MSEVIRVLAVIAIIGYVIGRQLVGEPLRGKLATGIPFAPEKDGRSFRFGQAGGVTPAGDADPAGHPGTGPADYVPHGGGAAPNLATLARLAGEWLAARRERGR